MNRILSILFLLVSTAGAETIRVSANLQTAINSALDGDTLVLAPGEYHATPAPFVEPTCGNCPEPQTPVPATRGFVIDAKRLTLRGEGKQSAILITRAGYGVLILNSPGVTLENLTITGGRRDPDGAATDAAIVIKHSDAIIRNCFLHDNYDYHDSTIVGIGGIIVREGARAWIERCSIVHNSWDGVALYRGAWAMISDCVIDSGRGAGIGVTWDAVATVLRNRISHYWKGIGSFGTATVVARNNIVCDNLGWGIIASGSSTMVAENNLAARNGNCGIAIWNRGTRGRIVNNLSAFNGWRKQWVCPCVGFWNQEGDTTGWVIAHNLVWNNVAGNAVAGDSLLTPVWSGFVESDPLFADTVKFLLQPASPALYSGDPELANPDGTRSHLGPTGGPAASPFPRPAMKP